MRHVFYALLAIATPQPALATNLRVPQDHKTIQAAIDVSKPGDTILIPPGKYRESIGLKSGIILRNDGDDGICQRRSHRPKKSSSSGSVSSGPASPTSGRIKGKACRQNDRLVKESTIYGTRITS